MQRLGIAKQIEISDLLDKERFSVLAVTETFFSDENHICTVNKDYEWIGKNRVPDIKQSGGGVGFFVRKDLNIIDNNALQSAEDSLERLWITVNSGRETIAIGVVYMPNDGLNRDLSDEVVDSLLCETAQLEAEGHKVIILTDFNGRLSKFRKPGTSSYNGDLLSMFVECSALNIVNTTEKCEGVITWRRGIQHSTIDYVLANDKAFDSIVSMLIDEKCKYSVGSDHYMIVISMNNRGEPLTVPLNVNDKKNENCHRMWNIKEKLDWSDFRTAINELLDNWTADAFETPEEAWVDWKAKVTAAGVRSIGYKQNNSNSRRSFDKEVSKLIHSRRAANRFHRFWLKSPCFDSDVIQEMWDEYLARKKMVKDTIIKKQVAHKTKVIMLNAANKSTSCRSFWRTLKGMNERNGAPIQIEDPDDPTKTITDPSVIKEKIGQYWESLGAKKTTNIESDTLTKLRHYEGTDSSEGLHSICITEDTVNVALNKLKNGKSYALDRIPNEFLKHGGTQMTKSIASLFRLCALLEQFPTEWQQGIIKPIHKSGDRGCLNNYRGITIASNVYKAFASLAENQIMQFAEENNLFGEYQGAFRKNRRLEDHIFTPPQGAKTPHLYGLSRYKQSL